MEDTGYTDPWKPSSYHISTASAGMSWMNNFTGGAKTPAAAQEDGGATAANPALLPTSSDVKSGAVGAGFGKTRDRFGPGNSLAAPIGVRTEGRSKGTSKPFLKALNEDAAKPRAAPELGTSGGKATPAASWGPAASSTAGSKRVASPKSAAGPSSWMSSIGIGDSKQSAKPASGNLQGGSSIGRFAAESAKPLPQVGGGQWVKGLLVPGSIGKATSEGRDTSKVPKLEHTAGAAETAPTDYKSVQDAIRKEREAAWKQQEIDRKQMVVKKKEQQAKRAMAAREWVPKDDKPAVSHGLQLQSLWIIPTAAVS